MTKDEFERELESDTMQGNPLSADFIRGALHGWDVSKSAANENDERMRDLAKEVIPHCNGQLDSFPDGDTSYELACRVLGLDHRKEHYVDDNGDLT